MPLVGKASITEATVPVAQDVQRLLESGQHRELDKFLSDLQQSGRSAAEISFLKGLVYLKRGQHDAAAAAFSVVPSSSPHYLDARNNLAAAYALQGKPALAKSTLEEALQANPSVALIHKNLNEIKFHLANRSYSLALQAMDTVKVSKPALVVATGLPQRKEPAVASAAPSVAAVPSASAAATTPVASREPPVTPSAAPAQPSRASSVPAPPAPSASAASGPASSAATISPANPRSLQPSADAEAIQAATRALYDWGKAWERKDIEVYLAAYALDFQPADGKSLAQWRKERQDRIVSKGRIQLQFSQIDATVIEPQRVRIRFVQNYRSDQLNATSRKTVEMKWDGQRWLITRERTSESGR